MLILEQARAYLAAINPALPAVVLVFVLWAPQAAIRRWLPGLWAWPASKGPQLQGLRQAWQSLPSLAGGALLGALTSGGDPWQAAWGAVVAAATPFLHHALKAIPAIPYRGELGGKPKDDDDDLTPPDGTRPRIHFENIRVEGGDQRGIQVKLERPAGDGKTDDTEVIQRWIDRALKLRDLAPGTYLLTRPIVFGALVMLAGCSPAHWAAQREAAAVVSDVANHKALPLLEAAFRADGLMGVERAQGAAEAQLYFIEWKARWLPVWAAWQVFSEAHAAWVAAINSEGDVLATAEAARNAFCLLKSNALKAGARMPDFPLLGCAP